MTLDEYEAKIKQLGKLDTGPIPVDGYDQPCYESPAEMAAEELASIAREIHEIAWSQPFRGWARELIEKAISEADRIAHENGRLSGYAIRVFS